MQFKINTSKLNSMLSKVQKGVGNGKILAVTSYLQVEYSNGELRITSTNLSNYITCIEKNVVGVNGEAIVKAETLIKLVAKTSKEEMSFETDEVNLNVKGNGNYKIPLLLDTAYPTYTFNANVESKQIDTAELKHAFSINECAIAKDMVMPCLTGYNLGGQCITTDGVKMCINNKSMFDNNVLLSPELSELIKTLTAPKTEIMQDSNKLMFITEDTVIFGTQLEGIENYPDISSVMEFDYDYNVSISKEEIVKACERMTLFADAYSNFGARLEFMDNALLVRDMNCNNTETIAYGQKSNDNINYLAMVNIQYLKDIIETIENATIRIYFGNDIAIKLEDKDTTFLLCLMSTN